MATLDMSGVLQAAVNATTPDAIMQRNMMVGVFSDKVTVVAHRAIKEYKDGSVECKKLEDAQDLTPEDSELIRSVLKDIMLATSGYVVDYHKQV